MNEPFQEGESFHTVHIVTAEMSPPHLPGVLATWRLIGLLEDACLEFTMARLDAAQTTVGTRVDVSHVGMARLGDEVKIFAELTKITGGRLLTFSVEARTPAGVISSGTHQRLIVDRARLV